MRVKRLLKRLSGKLIPAPVQLSIVVIFHNMRREAERTLTTLTPAYQGLEPAQYDVIAIDNGSGQPLNGERVEAMAPNFRYRFFDTKSKSPVEALNAGAAMAKGRLIVFMIDGARMLSPGVLRGMLTSTRLSNNPFVYTSSMHIGPAAQNESLLSGYCQKVEDEILAGVDWTSNGYQLFEVSSWALSSKGGFFSTISESNCFGLEKASFNRMGGFDDRFQTPGGGLANLDIFQRCMSDISMQPVMLLGEASFHQFHGGVATNVALDDHPIASFQTEYESIRGHSLPPVVRKPLYLGEMPQQALRSMGRAAGNSRL